MDKMRKKTPKNSNKRRKKPKETQENIIMLGIFLVFIVVVALLFYYLIVPSSNEDFVATVNGDGITLEELNWWYETSILPEHRAVITKQDFLMLSLIPQEALLQNAKKENIMVQKMRLKGF